MGQSQEPSLPDTTQISRVRVCGYDGRELLNEKGLQDYHIEITGHVEITTTDKDNTPRKWVVYPLDEQGNPISTFLDVVYSQADAEQAVKEWEKKYNQDDVETPHNYGGVIMYAPVEP